MVSLLFVLLGYLFVWLLSVIVRLVFWSSSCFSMFGKFIVGGSSRVFDEDSWMVVKVGEFKFLLFYGIVVVWFFFFWEDYWYRIYSCLYLVVF